MLVPLFLLSGIVILCKWAFARTLIPCMKSMCKYLTQNLISWPVYVLKYHCVFSLLFMCICVRETVCIYNARCYD